MEYRDLAMGIVLLSQTAVGILGNFSLLSYYLEIATHKPTCRDTDLILTHLLIANTLSMLLKGIPQTVAAFGWKQFFNDLVCRLFLYVERVGRSVSIATTCLLSVYQAITISPKNLCRKELKAKFQRYVGHSISFCWITYFVANFIFPLYYFIEMNSKNRTEKIDFEFCSTTGRNTFTDSLYAALILFPEVLFSVLIIWSSSSMIVTLHRHKQQVQHIRSSHISCRASPESRATRSILALVCTFLAFYTISSILRAFIVVLYTSNWWLLNINHLIALSFPSFGPFVLMSQDSSLSRACFVLKRNKNISNHFTFCAVSFVYNYID